jgi:hypothetical protein
MVRVSGVPYEVDFVQQAYDDGFNAGCQYEREAIIAIAEINGMTPKDIIRAIQERGTNEGTS